MRQDKEPQGTVKPDSAATPAPETHPGYGQPLAGIMHPADGTMSPPVSRGAPGKVAVRLTIQPGTDRYVDPAELPQLRAERLLIEPPAAAKAAGKDRQ